MNHCLGQLTLLIVGSAIAVALIGAIVLVWAVGSASLLLLGILQNLETTYAIAKQH